jgi:hypothetical protein
MGPRQLRPVDTTSVSDFNLYRSSEFHCVGWCDSIVEFLMAMKIPEDHDLNVGVTLYTSIREVPSLYLVLVPGYPGRAS